jgi:uncharacterized protein with PIN domain
MSTAYFLFLGRLNDFLPRDQRGQRVTIQFRERQSVKHLAESLGVPHPEIGRVQVNGHQEPLNIITQDGDHVVLHPIADGYDDEPRFVLDNHLGRLTAYLRMLGFDCLYRNDFDDDQLAEIAEQEKRILLSRDRRLLMRKSVADGYCLRSLDSLEQLTEVVKRFDLARRVTPFHRCLRCNHLLEPVRKEDVLDRLEPLTKKYFEEFHICPSCGQIYWKGSHYERMEKLVEEIENRSTPY